MIETGICEEKEIHFELLKIIEKNILEIFIKTLILLIVIQYIKI